MSEAETEPPVAVEEVAVPKTKKARKKAAKKVQEVSEPPAPPQQAATKKGRKKAAAQKVAPQPEPEPEPAPLAPFKKGERGAKMSDEDKTALKEHMAGASADMTPTEVRSMRMKLMSRMRRGMTLAEAKKDIA